MSGNLTSDVLKGADAYHHFRHSLSSRRLDRKRQRTPRSSHHAAILSTNDASIHRPPAPSSSHRGSPGGADTLTLLPTSPGLGDKRVGGLERLALLPPSGKTTDVSEAAAGAGRLSTPAITSSNALEVRLQ
ncbi:Hypothetical predicted protein [Pelobates cultripes]|uniref:Uncharacterized protein n=1 Tax=Pelobates cultripes TaxID=61616 RepID=A0AAD1TET3_PELCU|nr:Hypothetical predicted protein [Pelobates cultripes]